MKHYLPHQKTEASVVAKETVSVMKLIIAAGPTTCGKPEQPPNSTLISTDFNVNSRIEYVCDEGHLLVGPARRSCLPTGFYSEFPPVCRCKFQHEISYS